MTFCDGGILVPIEEYFLWTGGESDRRRAKEQEITHMFLEGADNQIVGIFSRWSKEPKAESQATWLEVGRENPILDLFRHFFEEQVT